MDYRLSAEQPADASMVEGIVARAFGPGRYAKAAERLREGSAPIGSLSFIAWRGEAPVGSVRLWLIAIGERPALLLGPIAVEAEHRSAGVGAALVRRACDAAAAARHRLILLVGDEPYFGPLGFSAAPAASVVMPGPVDQRRVLVRALTPGAAEGLKGPVRPLSEEARAHPLLAVAAS